jgi:antitoxin component YwqK of YwqJK toxin-antitoxin module
MNQDGKRILEMMYKNDQPDGVVKVYYPDGKLQETGNYRKGVKEGSWLEYDSNGNISNTSVFINGVLKEK